MIGHQPLQNSWYRSPEALGADVDLMLSNALEFNGEGSEIGTEAQRLVSSLKSELGAAAADVTAGPSNAGEEPRNPRRCLVRELLYLPSCPCLGFHLSRRRERQTDRDIRGVKGNLHAPKLPHYGSGRFH